MKDSNGENMFNVTDLGTGDLSFDLSLPANTTCCQCILQVIRYSNSTKHFFPSVSHMKIRRIFTLSLSIILIS